MCVCDGALDCLGEEQPTRAGVLAVRFWFLQGISAECGISELVWVHRGFVVGFEAECRRVASKGLLLALSLAVWVSEFELFLHPFPFLIEFGPFFFAPERRRWVRYHSMCSEFRFLVLSVSTF